MEFVVHFALSSKLSGVLFISRKLFGAVCYWKKYCQPVYDTTNDSVRSLEPYFKIAGASTARHLVLYPFFYLSVRSLKRTVALDG